MKLTKQLEAEIKKVMNTYWDSYLKGDIEKWASFLPDQYHNIGTNKEEEWRSKKEILDYTKKVFTKAVGLAELRNKKTHIIPYDPYMMVHEMGDLYIKASEGWIFYAPLRLSSLLEKTKKGWQVLHQHGSYPDSKSEDGEAFGFNEMKAENKKLRDAISRRTKELEEKNRELEIETSLERVRAVAMGMNRPEDLLSVCQVVFNELKILGFERLRNALIHTFNDDKEFFIDYDFSDFSGGTVSRIPYKGNMVIEKFINDIRKGKTAFSEIKVSGKQLIGWKEFRKANKEADDPRLDDIKVLYYYIYSIGAGSIGISTFKPIKDEHQKILKRFRNVFDLAYRRFMDIEKAIAQAREAQIEVSLERVRSRAMAMHKSEELLEVGEILYRELSGLGIEKLISGYVLIDEKEKMGWNYGVNPVDGSIISRPTSVPMSGTKALKAIAESWGKKEPVLVQQLNPVETIKHQTYIAENSINFPFSKKKLLSISPERLVIHTFNFSQGYLLIAGGKLLSADQQGMIVRFAKVFEMTYTRFLDLKKAESQAREAQIEAALERVRSRSMAMHKSEELADLSLELVKQVQGLGMDTWFCAFNIYDDDERGSLEWGSNGQGVFPKYRTPREGIFLRYYKAGRKGETLLINEIGEDECPAHYEYLCTLPGVGKQLLKMKAEGIPFPTSQIDHVAFFKYGYILFITYEPAPESHEVFKRFAKVFEQTYTRFLDLQKAEAQAREAQIDAALERIRSRTIGMQQSNELQEAALLMFRQIEDLDIPVFGCGFNIWDDDRKAATAWMAGKDRLQPPFKTSSSKDIFLRIHAAAQKGESLFVEEQAGKVLKAHYKYMSSIPVFKEVLNKMEAAGLSVPDFQIMHCAFFAQGYLMFISTEPVSNAYDIFKRFAKVFEQTYTRFLDLKKAEAQARESQIETALERVRSRTMGMQRSEELKEVIQVVYDQFVSLNINIEHTGFILDYKERDDMYIWLADKQAIQTQITLPYFDCAHWNSFIEAKKKGNNFFANHLTLKEKNKFYKDMFKVIPGIPEEAKAYYFNAAGLAISTVLLDNVGLYIENFAGIPYTDEENATLMRFGKVFQQTYTRFLDLQKAEAQAREAQIEAALERVRSRSMAMHNSNEIGDVALVLFQQLKSLGGALWGTGFSFCKNNSNVDEFWFANENGIMPHLKIPNNVDLTHKQMYKGWKNNLESLSIEKGGKELADHYKYMLTVPDVQPIFQGMLDQGIAFPKWQNWHAAYFKYGYMLVITTETYENEKIFKRFVKVFEQAYTRFLDLQKAEAQAKEAQIEAALEKVRSASLAMQTTNELGEVVSVIVEKLKDLGVVLDANGVVLCTYFKDSKDVMHWIVSPDFSIVGSYLLPYFDHPIFNDAWESKISGADYFSKAFSVEQKNSFFEYAFEHSDYKNFPDEFKEWIFQNDKHILSFAWQKNSAILIPSHTGVLPTAEQIEILKRFAKVFEQSYTRFLDLKKAEALTRETQIELSLERIRAQVTAMQQSTDLLDIVVGMHAEFTKLGHEAHYFWHMRWLPEKYDKAMTSGDGSKIGMVMELPRHIHGDIPLLAKWEKSNESSVVYAMDVEAALDYVDKMVTLGDFKQIDPNAPTQDDIRHIGGLTFIMARTTHGEIGYSLPGKVPNPPKEGIATLTRFAGVFDLAYKRFEDLKKAEQRARETQIELALEKVRSRTMAMKHSDELPDAANVLFLEIQGLGIPAWSAGYNILSEDKRSSTCIMSSEGEIQVPFVLPLTDHASLLPWHEAIINDREFFVYEQGGDDLVEHYNYMATVPGLEQVFQQFKDAGISLPTHQINHLVKFTNGFLLFITYEAVPNAHDIFKRFGKVFEQTYTRFLDLQHAEQLARQAQIDLENLIAAKKKTDDTITELRATQTQLVQSEKMASLGELTAGIAHEIQNPLNFVNNFSEVSNELLDEMLDAAAKGDFEEVKEILNDVKQNLEKINHHGKRADGIVKGMLQHSRSNSGSKEPTDINALADEYLRLAYHGLRAKDKSFNATMKTEFDNSLEKVNVIPQDIGRVVLNLITNAFYAVNEKKKAPQPPEGGMPYEPLVTVATQTVKSPLGDLGVCISVTDNGNGIPKKVLDKIFQPFFTTKPTGQGTGLGLSLAYDIVKAHGGELLVESKEGKGATFTICLNLV